MKLKITFLLLAFCVFSVSVFAQQASRNIEVKFRKGAISRTYSDNVSRSVNTYYLRARRGQTLTVKITSPGNIARFHVGTISPGSRDESDIKFIAEGDLTYYKYKINTDDEIAIPVGAIRNGSSYKLTITIK